MADDRLRELEKRHRATGLLDDEVAWLRERLRVGELTAEHLRLAAWLGAPAARLALADSEAVPSWERWKNLIARLGAVPLPEGALRTEFFWRACLAAFHATAAEWDAHLGGRGHRPGEVWAVIHAAEARIAAGRPPERDYWGALPGLVDSVSFADEPRVWTAIQAETLAWALGLADPVRERFEAQQREATGE